MSAEHVPIAPGIAIVCVDGSAPPDELRAFVAAQNKQLLSFSAAWNRIPVACAYYPDASTVPEGMPTIAIAARCDDPGALAYHTEQTDGRITGIVGVETCRDAGVPWTSAASHEVLEADVDPACNLFAQRRDGMLVAREASDPVQDLSETVDGVELSAYVLPSWFDADAAGPYDSAGALSAPFTRTEGGYYVEMTAGRTRQVGARAAYKAADGRGSKRHGNANGIDADTLAAVLEQARADGQAIAQVVHDVVSRLRQAQAKRARKAGRAA